MIYESSEKEKLCIVASSVMTVEAFLLPHLAALSERFDLVVVAGGDEAEAKELQEENVRFFHVPIRRSFGLWSDLVALVNLINLFVASRFSMVVSVTPKAGLLASVAGLLARVPHRIHWFTGQRWATETGWVRQVLQFADRIIVRSITAGLVDSPSQLEFLRNQNFDKKRKLSVLLSGSISGVDLQKFQPDQSLRELTRERLGVPDDTVVIIFVGRLTRDKGVMDLIESYAMLSVDGDSELWFAGPDEENLSERLAEKILTSAKTLRLFGETKTPAELMNAADILCLPSYREGFGSVVVEASSTCLPVIVSDIYGLRDSIAPGETGLVFPAGDIEALRDTLDSLVSSSDLRDQLGAAGREFVAANFSQAQIVLRFRDYLIDQKTGPRLGLTFFSRG